MRRISLKIALLAGVLSSIAIAQTPRTTTSRDCPTSSVDESSWVLARDSSTGIEMKHPADYREKRWESRSDTSGVTIAFWRNAVSRIEVNELQGFYRSRAPNASVAPCLIQTRSAPLQMHLERTTRKLWNGKDTVYFVGKGIVAPSGKPTDARRDWRSG